MKWKYGSSNWISPKYLKESYPVKLDYYIINNNIKDETAFSWWVPYVRKKRTTVLAKVKSKYWQIMQKYGIKIPTSVNEAYKIDTDNINN